MIADSSTSDERLKESIPQIVSKYKYNLCDAVLMMAAATGRLTYVNDAILTGLNNSGQLPVEFSETIDWFFMPSTMMQSTILVDSNVKTACQNAHVGQVHPDDFEVEDGARMELKNKWKYVQTPLSPNACSLFVVNTLVKNHEIRKIYSPSPTGASAGNLRNLDVERVFREDHQSEGNPGILGGLLGVSLPDYHSSITRMDYMMVPHVLVSSPNPNEAYPLEVGSVFAHHQQGAILTEPDHLYTAPANLDHAVGMINLLSTVCTIYSMCNLTEMGSSSYFFSSFF